MECNKEEAIRAKDMAENRMHTKDFVGARKLALKAQQLYPGLDNISQIVIICDVHISAQVNVVGSDMDWYGILQVQQTADELSIKKQYRKLALALHPDKNKFPGAEAAFKLIGEANRVLCDKGKRSLYDMKRHRNLQAASSRQPPPQMSKNAKKEFVTQTYFPNHSTSQHAAHQPEAQVPSFWTSCPFCKAKYHNSRIFLNKGFRCSFCFQHFIAYDMNFQGGISRDDLEYARNQAAACPCKDGSSQRANYASQQSTNGKSSSRTQCEGIASERANLSEPFMKTRTDAKFEGTAASGRVKFVEKRVEVNVGSPTTASSWNSGGEGERKRTVETRGSRGGENGKVEDAEVGKDKEMEHSPIQKKRKESLQGEDNLDVKCKLGSDLETQPNVGPIDYPEPEFHDFDKERMRDCFKVDQIWAVYDNNDGMPRWYARIRKIYSGEFKVQISWLEANPKDQCAIRWLQAELPVACGNFRSVFSQDTEDHLMFSHLATWEKGNGRGSYQIYPRKGDVWALFKDWSVEWISKPNDHKKYEFEFVEVLGDYAEGIGVEVSCLVMLEGYTSVFQRMDIMERISFYIKPGELLRFSHRVPFFRLTGVEREGLPAGSFELDPASVYTMDFLTTKGVHSVPKSATIGSNGFFSKPGGEKETPANGPEKLTTVEDCFSDKSRHSILKPSVLNSTKDRNQTVNDDGSKDTMIYRRFSPRKISRATKENCHDVSFHSFASEKLEMFQRGQIWALFKSQDGGLPKHYALVRKAESPEFKAHITWLEPCPEQEKEIWWCKKELPIACGKFKASKVENEIINTPSMFSHLVQHLSKRREFLIYPREGEVWATYRNWSADWIFTDLNNCEYEMVEILENSDLAFKVLLLEMVDGFKTVYRRVGIEMDIARDEMLRFSHMVPSFQLTKEGGGNLNGYLELDPAAVPACFKN